MLACKKPTDAQSSLGQPGEGGRKGGLTGSADALRRSWRTGRLGGEIAFDTACLRLLWYIIPAKAHGDSLYCGLDMMVLGIRCSIPIKVMRELSNLGRVLGVKVHSCISLWPDSLRPRHGVPS